MKNIWIGVFALFTLISCEPQEDDKIELPPPPSAAEFTIEEGVGPNSYILRNTTSGAFQFSWDFGNGQIANGEIAEAFYQDMGMYEIKLTVFTAGGSATSSKMLDVPEDAPFQCEGNPLYEFLSDCDQKVWKLNPADGALWVGPTDGSSTWWASDMDVMNERACAWDDTWTFTGDGEMIYETNGDIWGEDYMGFDFECVDETALQAPFDAWGSGNHSYALLAGNGTPDQLILTGLGAFMGLPKAANGAEVTIPQSGVTYDILRMEENGDNDLLEIEVNYSSGIWRFTFISQ